MSTGIEDWSPPPDDQVSNTGDRSDSTVSSQSAGDVVGDWTNSLGTLGKFVGGIATAASTIIGAKDAAVDRAQQRSYDQTLKGAQLDLARAQLDTSLQISKLNLQGALAKAQQQLRTITSGGGGGLGTLLLVGGGIYLLTHHKG